MVPSDPRGRGGPGRRRYTEKGHKIGTSIKRSNTRGHGVRHSIFLSTRRRAEGALDTLKLVRGDGKARRKGGPASPNSAGPPLSKKIAPLLHSARGPLCLRRLSYGRDGKRNSHSERRADEIAGSKLASPARPPLYLSAYVTVVSF